MNTQLSLPGVQKTFFRQRVNEAKKVIREVAEKSTKPLIIQFSGGNDSMTLVGLVQEVGIPKDRFFCCLMATGTELPGVVTFVRQFCKDQGLPLLVSNPAYHKGHIFKRIRQFQSFPNLGVFNGGGKRLWCCRDLKLRPQKKMINQKLGKGTYYRLEGIRRFESDRRKTIYRAYAETFMRPDDEFKGSFEVYPILNFTNQDVLDYIEKRHLPTLVNQYRDFGVSGCSWCPFYGPDIYAKVLAKFPTWYDRFIEMENELNQPSVHGGVFLRDIKKAVQDGLPLPVPRKNQLGKSPCVMEYEGKQVQTCSVYGHLYIDGVCIRCTEPEPEK
ncbi:MAG: phosphoadenosine phosphosulfate reductase family protein [Dehalococcoidales bacterium]|nr:phosphoadenosine phosphosulfate reductase family protein [Dehalococcoidales bacterium]